MSRQTRLTRLEREAEERWLANIAAEYGITLAEAREHWAWTQADMATHPEEWQDGTVDLVPCALRIAAERGIDPAITTAEAERIMQERGAEDVPPTAAGTARTRAARG